NCSGNTARGQVELPRYTLASAGHPPPPPLGTEMSGHGDGVSRAPRTRHEDFHGYAAGADGKYASSRTPEGAPRRDSGRLAAGTRQLCPVASSISPWEPTRTTFPSTQASTWQQL